MRALHELFLDAVVEERDHVSSRRRFLGGAGKLAGGGALAMVATAGPAAAGLKKALAQSNGDIDILNYALTLEHLEYAFYRDGIAALGAFDPLLIDVRNHEATHVDTLTQVILNLGGQPVAEACYTFAAMGIFASQAAFLDTARVLENTGVMAYDGAIAMIQSPDLQTAGATIATVEARHASYLNLVTGFNPFPAAFDTPASTSEVLAAAGQFIGDCNGAPAPAPTRPPAGNSGRTIRGGGGGNAGNGGGNSGGGGGNSGNDNGNSGGSRSVRGGGSEPTEEADDSVRT